MAVNSKQKGNRQERVVAKKFQAWSGYDFCRTPMSGAMRNFDDERVISDICVCMDLMKLGWKYSIEVKNVEYPWDFDNFLTGKNLFWAHWKQATDDADREKQRPILIFTKNRKKTYCALYQRHLKFILGKLNVPHLDITTNDYDTISIIDFDLLLEKSKVKDWCS